MMREVLSLEATVKPGEITTCVEGGTKGILVRALSSTVK
jgi:hypothetical protein